MDKTEFENLKQTLEKIETEVTVSKEEAIKNAVSKKLLECLIWIGRSAGKSYDHHTLIKTDACELDIYTRFDKYETFQWVFEVSAKIPVKVNKKGKWKVWEEDDLFHAECQEENSEGDLEDPKIHDYKFEIYLPGPWEEAVIKRSLKAKDSLFLTDLNIRKWEIEDITRGFGIQVTMPEIPSLNSLHHDDEPEEKSKWYEIIFDFMFTHLDVCFISMLVFAVLVIVGIERF